MDISYYYIVTEINGQRLFIDQDGDYSENFDVVMRFETKLDATIYASLHCNSHRVDIIGILK